MFTKANRRYGGAHICQYTDDFTHTEEITRVRLYGQETSSPSGDVGTKEPME